MHSKVLPLAALALHLTAAAGLAETASPEGAERLATLMQGYLGGTAGVITVVPEGDAYAMTLDFNPLIALAPGDQITASIAPMVLQLVDRGDGTWAVSQDQALALSLDVPGIYEVQLDIGRITTEGVFDPALPGFSSAHSEFADLTMTQTTTDPVQGALQQSYAIAKGSYDGTATATATGEVDSQSDLSMTGISEVIAVPGPDPAAEPITISLRADTYSARNAITGLHAEALFQLLAFFVAHPSQAAITTDQARLKTVISDGLPFFANINSTGSIKGIVVDSPLFSFGLQELGIEVEANGIADQGMIREAFTLKGLTLPEGLVPGWAADLMPQSLAMDFKLSGFNLAAPAGMILAAVDLAAPEPLDPSLGPSLLAELLPEGSVDITLAPGNVTSGIYDLRFEGAMAVGPEVAPSGAATVTFKGITAVEQVLAAGPPDITGQFAATLAMAEGMAVAGDDGALVWKIEATPAGTVLINGTDLMVMGGQ